MWIGVIKEPLFVKVLYFLLQLADLSEINTKRAPQDKLACVVRCCKKVFSILTIQMNEIACQIHIPLALSVVITSLDHTSRNHPCVNPRWRSCER